MVFGLIGREDGGDGLHHPRKIGLIGGSGGERFGVSGQRCGIGAAQSSLLQQDGRHFLHGREELTVRGIGDVCSRHIREYGGDGVAEIVVDGKLAVRVHGQVHHHHSVLRQMIPHESEEFGRGHLKGDRDVLVGVDHDHVIFFLDRLDIGAAIVFRDLDAVRKVKILFRETRDLAVDLHAFHRRAGKIACALGRESAGAVAEDEYRRRFLLRHDRRGQGVVVVEAGESAFLHGHGLYTEQHVGGEDDLIGILAHLQIVVYGFALIDQILFPEGKGIVAPEDHAENEERGCDVGTGLFPFRADEEDQGDGKQDSGEDEKGDGGPHGGDGHEGGQEGADDAADGVAGAEPAHGAAALIQAFDGGSDKAGRHGAEKEEREHEDDHAAGKGGPDEEVRVDGEHHQGGNAEDHILACDRDHGDPDRGDQDAAVESCGIRILVGRSAAVEVAEGHGDHDDTDDDGPDDLRRAEVGRKQAAGSELDGHHGDAGEELGEVQEPFVLKNAVFHSAELTGGGAAQSSFRFRSYSIVRERVFIPIL